MHSPEWIVAKKAELRAAALARRDALPPVLRAEAAETVAARPFPLDVPRGAVVSGYMPIRSEINPISLLRRLGQAGARLALPRIVGRGQPLRFRAYAFGDNLTRGQWGLREPDETAAELDPDIMVVPLVAFDRRGHRIGYGAGYFDMSIAALRAKKQVVAVGLAYAAQEVDEIPVLPHDARLDLVLTERSVVDCRGA